MRYCFALDLNEDLALIEEYEQWHKNVWPEIKVSIKTSGITEMEIYRTGNRLFMIMETDASFSFSRKAAMDAADAKVQKPLPWAMEGEKWILMNKIFQLEQHTLENNH
jgi:L-rhamnose mutarotase